MPISEQQISPTAEGAARSADVHQFPLRAAGGTSNTAMVTRSGGGFTWQGTSSNWGLAGVDTGTIVLYKGASVYQYRGGGMSHEYRIPLVTTRPTAIKSWRDGLYVFEVVMAWSTNTAAVENGIVFGFQDNVSNLRCVTQAQQGWCVYNDGGVLKFSMRGPVSLQTTSITPAITATEFTKVRIEFRHATQNTDASVLVFVNDAGTPNISKTSADANFPAIGAGGDSVVNIGLGINSATEYLLARDLCFWRGPNTSIGM